MDVRMAKEREEAMARAKAAAYREGEASLALSDDQEFPEVVEGVDGPPDKPAQFVDSRGTRRWAPVLANSNGAPDMRRRQPPKPFDGPAPSSKRNGPIVWSATQEPVK
jgi:hypothetical protein